MHWNAPFWIALAVAILAGPCLRAWRGLSPPACVRGGSGHSHYGAARLRSISLTRGGSAYGVTAKNDSISE